MMSCGVSLERLQIKSTDMLSTSTKLEDAYKANTSQHTCRINELVDLEGCDFQKDIRKMQKKQCQKIRQDVCSVDSTYDGDSSTLSTANLRLTLKKVKVETGDKEEDTCLYECHTEKLNTSKNFTSKTLLVKCAEKSSNNNTSRPTKDSDILTDSGKVIC